MPDKDGKQESLTQETGYHRQLPKYGTSIQTLIFDILFADDSLTPITNKYDFHAALMCSVMDRNAIFQDMSKIKDTQLYIRSISFFIPHMNFTSTSRVSSSHCESTIGILYVFNHSLLAETGRWITICAVKQNGGTL